MAEDASAQGHHKLQVLAQALALDFSQSLASARCCAALQALLPGLRYFR